jgi:hypothetical protein
MAKIEIRNELFFKAPTRVGLLADVSEALANAGVDLYAIGAYDKDGLGEFLLLTSNNRTAAEALEPLEGTLDMVPVVVAEVPNEPGTLAEISRRIADAGINVGQIYATTAPECPTATMVLLTDDEPRVEDLLADV